MHTIEEAKRMEWALNGLARAIESILKQEFGDLGFALLIFNFGDDGFGNYISNAARGDMVKVLRKMANRLENRQDIPFSFGSIQ